MIGNASQQRVYKGNIAGKLTMPTINLLEATIVELYKNQIRNTIKTYPTEWRVIFETLQNSIDAINKGSIKDGKINITLNLIEGVVQIKDNGKGFPCDKTFFFLSGGDKKDDEKTKGKIGVGLKVVIFSSSTFYLESTFTDADGIQKRWTANIKNGHKYLETDKIEAEISELITAKDATGTYMTYSFPDDSILDFILKIGELLENVDDEIELKKSAKFTKAMEYVFRVMSYAGDVTNLLENKNNILISVKIIYDKNKIPADLKKGDLGVVFEEENGQIEFKFNDKFWDIKELIDKRKGMGKPIIFDEPVYEETTKYGKYNSNYIWLKKYDKSEAVKLLGKKAEQLKGNYSYLLGKINGIYVAIGSFQNMKKYFINPPYQIVTINGVPSDHHLKTPSGGDSTYSRNVLLLIDVDSELNYGKLQTTNRKLIGDANKFYSDIFQNTLKKVAKKIVGQEPEGDSSTSFLDDSVETNIVRRKDLGVECSFVKEPFDENGLIAIFFDLLGRGILKNYEVYSLHSKLKYDGKFMAKLETQSGIKKANSDNELGIIEFKLRLSDLIDEFDNDKKVLRQINLVIVWEDDFAQFPKYAGDYEVIDLIHSKDKDKGFYGITKCLRNRADGTERQLLILKDFIDKPK